MRKRLLVLLRLDELDKLLTVSCVEKTLLLLEGDLGTELVDLDPVAVCASKGASAVRAVREGEARNVSERAPRMALRMRLKYERCVCFSASLILASSCMVRKEATYPSSCRYCRMQQMMS